MAAILADTGGVAIALLETTGVAAVVVSSKAPEIDAASGTSAIALLTGMVLLMKERRRSKRSSKSDE